MQHPAAKLGYRKKLCGIAALVLALPLASGVVPAHAEGLFGLFKMFAPPSTPAQPTEFNPALGVEQPKRKVQHKPKPAPVEQPAIKLPIVPRPVGEIANPVPALLADSTLRRGDMVMFPDGLRVFTGQPADQHKLAEFAPVAQAGKTVSQATRKLVAKLGPGENIAWSTEGFRSGSKLAVNTRDAETTGSVRRTSSRGSSR
jgi:hypothetical protein